MYSGWVWPPHLMPATPIQISFIFREPQWGNPPESFIQKYWRVSKLPIFQNYFFSKKGPKSPRFFEKLDFFPFLVEILLGFSMVYWWFLYSQWLWRHRRKLHRLVSTGHHCTWIFVNFIDRFDQDQKDSCVYWQKFEIFVLKVNSALCSFLYL